MRTFGMDFLIVLNYLPNVVFNTITNYFPLLKENKLRKNLPWINCGH